MNLTDLKTFCDQNHQLKKQIKTQVPTPVERESQISTKRSFEENGTTKNGNIGVFEI